MSHDADPPGSVQARLQRALRAALQARDMTAVSALRSAQAAISNAEAVDPPAAGQPGRGPGSTDVPRRALTTVQERSIVAAEISERLDAARLYGETGHADRAARLLREAGTLRDALAGDPRS